MTWQLTRGALATIMRGGTVEDPIVQILDSNKMTDQRSSERYQLLVSDGCHLNRYTLLASHLNGRLTSGELSNYSVVRMNRFYTTVVNKLGRPEMCVIIINDLTILAKGREVGMKIGNPVAFPEGSSSAVTLPAPTASVTTLPAQSWPQLNDTLGLTPTQPMQPKMEIESPADIQMFLNTSLGPFQSKSVEQEIQCIVHDISSEISRRISQMQYNITNLLNVYEWSLTDLKKTVDDSVQKRNEGLLTLHNSLSSPRHRFLPMIRNQLAENVAFAHLVTKQVDRNGTAIQAFARSHLQALSQLRQFLIAHLQKVHEMVEKINVDH